VVAEDAAGNGVAADILANDGDVDGDTITVTDISNVTGGSADLDAGVVTYTPDADACGDGYGSFDYEISDGNGGTANGHAEVNVTCVDDPPVATDDSATGTEDTDLVLTGASLTSNDTDIENDDLTVTAIENMVGGTAALNGGDVTFSPDADLCGDGVASFDYTVDDGNGGTDTGHVVIDLTCVNDAPVGVDDSGMVDVNSGAADYAVLDNDTDVEHDALSLVSVSVDADQGDAEIHAGKVRFTPATNFQGQAVISYTLTDGDKNGHATLTVTVGPDVDAPVVAKPTVAFGSGRVNETAPLRISWSAFDAGVGVASYDVQVSIAGGAFKPVYSGPHTAVTAFYPFKKSLVWRVRATDHQGNVSGWMSSATRSLSAVQNSNRSIHYKGNWHGVGKPASSGNGYIYSTTINNKANLKFTGRSVLYVAPKSKASGYVKVYVDGAMIGRYKLHNGKFVSGRIVSRFSWATSGNHRIRIVNDKNGKRTNLDAFIVLK
jgi:Bacterial Ig domain/Cadherin-like domain